MAKLKRKSKLPFPHAVPHKICAYNHRRISINIVAQGNDKWSCSYNQPSPLTLFLFSPFGVCVCVCLFVLIKSLIN